ncbi:MAG: Dabb family protein [Cyclobacteriaceae bacterium]
MVHYVLFWLKNPDDPAARKTMEEGLKKLVTIGTIKSSFLGTPANTEQRDVTDNSFTYSLMVAFEDVAAHDSYQVDSIHHQFIDACKDLWESVKVFDSAPL